MYLDGEFLERKASMSMSETEDVWPESYVNHFYESEDKHWKYNMNTRDQVCDLINDYLSKAANPLPGWARERV